MNNEKDVKPSERIQLLKEKYKYCLEDKIWAIIDYLDEQHAKKSEKVEENHCKDCCCAKSWEALGITKYTGKSIPEHISDLRKELNELKYGSVFDKPSPSSEPSRYLCSQCEEEVSPFDDDHYKYCKGIKKPAEQPKENEVDEPFNERTLSKIVKKRMSYKDGKKWIDLVGFHRELNQIIKNEGYSKLPPQDRLVGLDEDKVYRTIEYAYVNCSSTSNMLAKMAEAITQKFGQRVLSVEEIFKLLREKTPLPIKIDLSSHDGGADKYFKDLSEAIHQALVKEE